MMFSSFPSDMENFNAIIEDQAYRLLKTLWKKIEKKHMKNKKVKFGKHRIPC